MTAELVKPRTLYVPEKARDMLAVWRPILPILFLALAVRVVLMPVVGYKGDTEHFAYWVQQIHYYGLWNFYGDGLHTVAWDRTYPALSTLVFGFISVQFPFYFPNTSPAFAFMLKLFPVLAEVAMVAAVYYWLRNDKRLRIWIPLMLAIYPGLIATTAWWGQFEATYGVFLVLSLIAFNKDRPIWAWVFFGIAVLLKQPAAAMAPVVLALTLRRYGWRTVLTAGTVVGVMALLVMLPFMLVSGPQQALTPYIGAADAFPYMANNAYNLWYVGATLRMGHEVVAFLPYMSDAQMLIGPLKMKTAGMIMLGLFAILMGVIVWRNAEKRYEFVWGAAMFWGFFLFPTQVHERYLYPGAILVVIAIVQEPRLIWAALIGMLTYTYNICSVAFPLNWPSVTLAANILSIPVALINIGVFCNIMFYTLRPQSITESDPEEPAMTASAGLLVAGK
jgi:hypothetical protein